MKRKKTVLQSAMQALSDNFAETLWPSRCVGCDVPGSLLCKTCDEKLERINLNLACPRCGAPWGHTVCTECPNPGSVDRHELPIKLPFCFEGARAACSFEGIAEKLIRSYKDHDERRCTKIIAREIARAVYTNVQFDHIIAIPASKQAIKKRGFDHMACIAKELGVLLDIDVLEILESKKSADQRLLNAEERQKNKKGSFGIRQEYVCSKKAYALRAQTLKTSMAKNADIKDGVSKLARCSSTGCSPILAGRSSTGCSPSFPSGCSPKSAEDTPKSPTGCSPKSKTKVNYFLKGKRILLIDDVFTTGATLNAASETLLENGAESVHVAVFARVW